jgi:hypothetical protein
MHTTYKSFSTVTCLLEYHRNERSHEVLSPKKQAYSISSREECPKSKPKYEQSARQMKRMLLLRVILFGE